MKTLYSLLFFACLTSMQLLSQAKTNLVFFSEQGEQFLVVLNGIQQNFNPQTNVKVTDLNQPFYSVKIRFIDGRTPDLDKKLHFNPGTETTFALKKNKKGKYLLRWQSEVPIHQATQDVPNQNVVIYTTTPANDLPHNQPNHTPTNQTTGNTSATGCSWPMEEASFERAYLSIEEKSFESSKLTVAKQVFNTNCMTSEQVKRVLLLFSFEATRLDFAKYAYGYTYDISNYFLLNDAFNFESSIDELNEYILNFKW